MGLQQVEQRPRRRFTADEVYRMLGAGVLTEDDPAELIDGETGRSTSLAWTVSELVP